MFQLLWSFFIATAFASPLPAEVAQVHLSADVNKPNLVFLHDGRVSKIPAGDPAILPFLFQPLRLKSKPVESHGFALTNNYTPTILPNMPAAQAIFDELNPYYRRSSECYNRAHIWAYEEFKKRNLYSMKVFLFFTTKYIWDYDWGWWFHVSPYVMITFGDVVIEHVIDYAFMRGPTKMHDWTSYFMIPETVCPAVEKYSDYDNHQQESYCYLIKRPMYFWQPQDIYDQEQKGIEKTGFIQSDVDEAYYQGF